MSIKLKHLNENATTVQEALKFTETFLTDVCEYVIDADLTDEIERKKISEYMGVTRLYFSKVIMVINNESDS